MLRNWKFWLGLIVGSAGIYFTLRDVRFADLGAAFGRANLAWYAPAIIAFGMTLALRAYRWSLLLGGTSFWTTLHANNVGYLLNATLPLRIGELGRAYVVSERTPVNMARALSAIVVERLIDLSCVVLMFGICAQFIVTSPALARAASVAGVAAVAASVGFAVLIWQSDRVERAARGVAARVAWFKADWVLQRFHELSASFHLLVTSRRVLVMTVVSTIGVWISGIAVQYLILGAFLAPSAVMASFVTVMGNLGGALPALPGGMGPVQYFATQALVEPFKVDASTAVAFAFASSFSQQIALILAGLVGLSRLGLTFTQVSRRAG